jgi:hypothetical protein
MNRIWISTAAGVVLALGAGNSFGATQIGDHFTFSGYGTLGLTRTDTDDWEYIRDGQVAGADTGLDFNTDSNLGLQLTGRANKWLSATVQVLTQERYVDNMDTEVEWAYIKIEPVEDLSLLLGRVALPTFAISDTRNIGYANTWIRPPNEVYGMAVIHRLNGAQLSYRRQIGPVNATGTILAGESQITVFATDFDVKRVKGWNIQTDIDWVTLRVGRVWCDNQLGGGLEDRYTFSGVGVLIDHNNVVAQGEFVTRRSGSFPEVVDADGWYVLGGYRFGKFLPYASYATTNTKFPQSLFVFSAKQSTFAAGLRWDAFSSAALKFQVDHSDTDNTQGISFVAGNAGTPAVTKSVTVFSLALDVVF